MNRRSFLQKSSFLAGGLLLSDFSKAKLGYKNSNFRFMLLGDLHFDKLYHHDFAYIKEKYKNDFSQIQNYSMITERYLPELLKTVKIAGTENRVDFYLQLGDFLEGLCGSKKLAKLQCTEFIDLIKKQELGKPFYVIKGNHDITGDGAEEVYNEEVINWQQTFYKEKLHSACASFVYSDWCFIVFDCYKAKESFEWLKQELTKINGKKLVFLSHMPIIPFGARSNWTVFSSDKDELYREELINLLGAHKTIVYCAHLHKTCVLERQTNNGYIKQVCIGSVVNPELDIVKDHISGIEHYGADLTDLEPNFNPSSLDLRRKILEREKPNITFFEYADFCGYAFVEVNAGDMKISFYQNHNPTIWKTFNLNSLINIPV